MNRIVLLISVITVIAYGCNKSKETSEQKKNNENSEYQHVKYNFYVNSSGVLFEKKYGAIDNLEMERPTWYDSTLFFPEWPNTKPLDSFVHIDTYEIIKNSGYSKDNSYVYYFRATSDGGQRHIAYDADPWTFMSLGYSWGKDKNNIFWKYMIIENADVNSFQVSKTNTDSALDKNSTFFMGEALE